MKKNIKEKEQFTEWNILDYLKTEKEIETYLDVVAMENDPNALVSAIGTVVRARGVNDLSKRMHVSRESLYKSFSNKTKPRFETIYKAIDSLGFRIAIIPKTQ
jgi:probable addiction module antidote protein